MFRTSLELNYIKRTFRPLYGWTQATPQSAFLDPGWTRSVAIFPGMVATRTTGNNHTLLGSSGGTAASDQPSGFFAQFIGGNGVDELLESGINALAVWVLNSDAEFEVLAPAFDTTQNWTGALSLGQDTLVYASYGGSNQGQLVLSSDSHASSQPVARLVQIESSTSLIIGGLRATL